MGAYSCHTSTHAVLVIIFHCLLVDWVSFCGLIRGNNAPRILTLCFVLMCFGLVRSR